MNAIAGWMIMVGLLLTASALRDVATAIEKQSEQCITHGITGEQK